MGLRYVLEILSRSCASDKIWFESESLAKDKEFHLSFQIESIRILIPLGSTT